MNSEGKIGVLLHWLVPASERDYNNLKATDFEVLDYNRVCSRVDGMPIDFSGAPDAENMEWLLIKEGERVNPDYSLYVENVIARPTNTKDEELINYNLWLIEYNIVRRSNEEIITAIKEYERQANLSVQSESDKTKTDMVYPSVLMAMASNTPLTEEQLAVKNRVTEIANRATMNAANAKALIELVLTGVTPDIKIGWQYDNISAQTAFYND